MKLIVTNKERAALATLMIPVPWSGTEEFLGHYSDAYEAIGLEEFEVVYDGQRFNFTDALVSGAMREVDVAAGGVGALLATFPGHQTPGLFGRAKVSLLRKLRALVPKEEAPAAA